MWQFGAYGRWMVFRSHAVRANDAIILLNFRDIHFGDRFGKLM
jgi:hypothetical protein